MPLTRPLAGPPSSGARDPVSSMFTPGCRPSPRKVGKGARPRQKAAVKAHRRPQASEFVHSHTLSPREGPPPRQPARAAPPMPETAPPLRPLHAPQAQTQGKEGFLQQVCKNISVALHPRGLLPALQAPLEAAVSHPAGAGGVPMA